MQFKPRLKVYQGSNRKNEFNPETFKAYSYGHWCYVMKVKGYVIFNDYRYSNTTNKHQWEMRGFLKSTMKVKESSVIYVDQCSSLTKGIDLSSHYEKLFLAEMRLKAKGRRADFYKTQQEIVKKMKEEIKVLKSCGAKLYSCYGTLMDLKEFKQRVIQTETERLEEQREASRLARAKRKEVEQTYKQDLESVETVSI